MDDRLVIIILVIVKVIILSLISIGAFLYAIPICFIRRFRTPLNLLTLNVCIATFICATFWIIYYIMNTFYPYILWTPASCLPILYIQTTVNCQVLYALCMVSFNRLLTVVYRNKALFHTKVWLVVCVIVQWIFATLVPLPTFASSLTHCFISGLQLNYQIYTLIIIGVIPTISLAISNTIIYISARRSTQRVQPINSDNASASPLGRRSARLLKHILFMFVVFFCGWIPIYIIAAINWDGTAIPYVLLHGLQILPVCCGTSNKLHMKECQFLNEVGENEEFLNIIQQCKNDDGLIDPEILIKQMENSSNEHIKHNADAVRKKLKNFLPNDKNDQKHVLEENLLINTLKGGMQDAIDKVKSPRNSIKK